MKIIKDGNKKFKTLYKVNIVKCKCNVCCGEFEAQEGELPPASGGGYYSMICPCCCKHHSDYILYFNYREDWVELYKVAKYDSLKNTKREIEV